MHLLRFLLLLARAPSSPRLKEEWAGDPSRAQMLEMLEPYETHAAPFIISGLQPKEPFATAIHGDLQPSNLFFKEKTDGEHTIKVRVFTLSLTFCILHEHVWLLNG